MKHLGTKNNALDIITVEDIPVGDNTFFNSISQAQLFNPNSSEVTAGSSSHTLNSDEVVIFVALNGVILKTSEFSLTGFTLDVTPENGYNSITDEISVFQSNFEASGNRTISNRIVVKQASDLENIDSTKQYFIDGLIDMGTTPIIIPTGGIFLAGLDYFLSGLYSTADNYTMFINENGTVCSNFRSKELNFWASGTNSKIFDLEGDGNGAIEFNSCNQGDFAGTTTSLGELTNFRQFRTNDTGFFLLQDGLTFSGTWSGGFRIGDSIALATLGTMTLFKEGTNLTFQGRCVSDGNFASLNNTTTVFGFQESNFILDGGFQLNGAAFNPDANAVPNISESSTKVFFRDCVGIRNTRIGCEMEFTTQVNTPLTVNTPAKALGTTVTTNATWMSQTANNEITYESGLIKDLKVNIPLTIDGGSNDEIRLILRRWDNSAGLYQDVKSKIRNISNLIGGIDVASYNLVARVNDMDLNDRLEIWIENTTDGTDAAVQIGSEMIVEAI